MKNQRGFVSATVLIAIVLGLVVVGGGAYFVVHQRSSVASKPDCSSSLVYKQNELLARACATLAGTIIPLPNESGTNLTLEYRPGGLDLGPSWVAYSSDNNVALGIYPSIKTFGEDGGEIWYAIPFRVHTNSPNRTKLYLGLFSLPSSSQGPLTYRDVALIGSQVGYDISFRELVLTSDGSVQVPYFDMRDENGNMLKNSREASITFVRKGDKLTKAQNTNSGSKPAPSGNATLKTYTDSQYKFSIQYPSDLQPPYAEGDSPALLRLSMSGANNFAAGFLIVKTNSVANCLVPSESSTYTTVSNASTITLNGIQFFSFVETVNTPDQLISTHTYRTQRNNVCYEISTSVSSQSDSSYTTSQIPLVQQDRTSLSAKLDPIVQSFHFN
jgi:hypothetical protein